MTSGRETRISNPLAAHLLDENRDLHFATGLHVEVTGHLGLGDHDGNVRASLADEAVLDLTGGEELALASGERRVVHEAPPRDTIPVSGARSSGSSI